MVLNCQRSASNAGDRPNRKDERVANQVSFAHNEDIFALPFIINPQNPKEWISCDPFPSLFHIRLSVKYNDIFIRVE